MTSANFAYLISITEIVFYIFTDAVFHIVTCIASTTLAIVSPTIITSFSVWMPIISFVATYSILVGNRTFCDRYENLPFTQALHATLTQYRYWRYKRNPIKKETAKGEELQEFGKASEDDGATPSEIDQAPKGLGHWLAFLIFNVKQEQEANDLYQSVLMYLVFLCVVCQ